MTVDEANELVNEQTAKSPDGKQSLPLIDTRNTRVYSLWSPLHSTRTVTPGYATDTFEGVPCHLLVKSKENNSQNNFTAHERAILQHKNQP
uniref:SFRICE_030255 n=1 Tax=Spodoptera frugiperda TaxID=7108 RepID=A0A2H1V713_SPOFR